MKTKGLQLILGLLLLVVTCYAQQGINYKAIIHDANGEVLVSTMVTVQFTILENGSINVYQDSHSPTTDDNGIIIVNIGEGSVISGDFSSIGWGSNSYFLKTEINIGEGFTNMGTTEFKAVPYALHSETASTATNVTELQTQLGQLENRMVLLENQIDSLLNSADTDGDGYTIIDGDCNDYDKTVYPGAAEICDAKDNDCDNQVDEGGVCINCPVEIMFALDGSGSIYDNRLSSLRTSLKSAFQAWSIDKSQFNVTMLEIADDYYPIHSRTNIVDGLSSLSDAIDGWEPSSGYNCFPQSFISLYPELSNLGESGTPKFMVIITDSDNPYCLTGEKTKDDVISAVQAGYDNLGIKTLAIGWDDVDYLNGIAIAGGTEPAAVSSELYFYFDDYLIEFDYGCTVECNPGDPCDDGDPCTINDVCDGSGVCIGTPIACGSNQIAEARATPDGICAVQIQEVLVTYVLDNGYTVQAEQEGPAVFVYEGSGWTPDVSRGDIISFMVTEMGTFRGIREVKAYDQLSIISSGHDLNGLVQDLTNSSTISLVDFETELITITCEIVSNFDEYGIAQVETDLVSGLELRVASGLETQLYIGDIVTIGPTPLWRYDDQLQIRAWIEEEIVK